MVFVSQFGVANVTYQNQEERSRRGQRHADLRQIRRVLLLEYTHAVSARLLEVFHCLLTYQHHEWY